MPKRSSELSKILKFFMSASEADAKASLDAASTIVATRFAEEPAVAAKKPGRKPGSGRKAKQAKLPGTSDPDNSDLA